MADDQTIHIWPQKPASQAGGILCRAVVECPGRERFNLDYCFTDVPAGAVSDRADAYACAALFLAMSQRRNLHIHGTVSPSLLCHLEEFVHAWHNMLPEAYAPSKITADDESESRDTDGRSGTLLTYSGGADATYTLWRHTRGDAERLRRHITGAVFVHGFDIAAAEIKGYEQAARRAEAITRSVDVPLIRVSTNFRDLPLDWEHVHGSAVASIHLLLQRGFDSGLIASGHTYRRLHLPWGSQPVTDWMFGTRTYPITHDAAFVERWQKIQALSSWAQARENLRVCYDVQSGDNCGRCYKCLRAILLFRAVGGGLPACFEKDVDEQFLRDWPNRYLRRDAARSIAEILHAAKVCGTQGPWIHTLEQVRERIIKLRRGPGWVKQTRIRLALGTRLRRMLGWQRSPA